MNNTATLSKNSSETGGNMQTPTSPRIHLKEENIIVSYTRKDALVDKQQFNVDEIDLIIRRDTGIKVPLFIADTVEWILFDICNNFVIYAQINKEENSFRFSVAIKYLTSNKNIRTKDC